MNKKMLVLSVILLLTAMCITSASLVKVQGAVGDGQWITNYSIKDAGTGVTLYSKDFASGATSGTGQILENEGLEVTVTINIATSNPSSDLTLATKMGPLSGQSYWSPGSNYNLGGNYNPTSPSIQFPENSGTLVISCYGETPSNVVESTTSNGASVNIPYPFQLVTLYDPTGATLDAVQTNLINGAIANYLTLLGQKEATLKSYQSSGVESGFVAIYKNVINASETLNNEGFTAGAVSALNSLNVSAPPSAASQAFYIPIAVVLAVVAAVFAFLFMRIRGRVSYLQLVVEDQVKDLEGLSMRVSRIDRNAAANLQSVTERLKRLVGA